MKDYTQEFVNDFKDDIKQINEFLKTKDIYVDDDYIIAKLYNKFCSDFYFANWLVLNVNYLEEFAKWIVS